MIKRIIFDIDDTLMPWKDEYYMSLNKVLDSLHFPYDNGIIKKIIMAVNDYENKYHIYNKVDMLDLMNNYTGKKLPNNFIDLWLEELAVCSDKADPEIIATLEYLNSKYDLVVLTNWFSYSQIRRLEKAGIVKYFSHVFCSDTFPIKPFKESYLMASQGYKPSECVMIGDSIKSDIDGALNIGMKAILYNYNHNEITENYQSITKFSDLQKIL